MKEAASIPELLRARAERAPNMVALVAPGRPPLSYAGLAGQVDEAIAALNRTGVGRRDRVALVLPQGPEMTVAFLAAAACAAAAPLNPAYGAGEFDFYLADLCPRALVVAAGLDSPARAVARARGIPVLELSPGGGGAGRFTLAGGGAGGPAHGGLAEADDVALVLHTSGTTARPKIIPLTHRNFCASARGFRRVLDLSPRDRCLNVMPLFHVHALIFALASLAAGASVACTPAFDPTRFFAWMDELAPTWYTAVPTIHQAVVAQAALHRATIARRPLRFIRSSAAPLPPQVMAELERTFGAPVVEGYGQSESVAFVTHNPLPPGRRVAGSVGVAAGPELAILDGAGRPLPAGETGEIVVRGENVFGGYANDPEVNARAFRAGWYRTGDLGYLDADEYLFITGRLKEIINRGGEKISPREVDEALLDHPAVAQAVTFPIPHPTLGEDVAAAVVLRPDAAATEAALSEFLAPRLAPFKRPRHILILPEIPKGHTGKPERIGMAQRLGLAGPAAGKPRAPFVAPRTEMEAAVARIWGEVLGLAAVEIHEDFLDVGGDSLRATQVLSRVRERFGVEVPLPDFLGAPTVAGLAAVIARRLAERAGAAEGARLLAEVEALSEAEARRLAAEATRAAPPATVPQLLAARSQCAPDAVALLAPGRPPLGYGRLHAEVLAGAAALNALGVGRGERLAVVLPDGPELAVALLAVTAAATAVPFNPAHRAAEIEGVFGGANLTAILVEGGGGEAARRVAETMRIPVIELFPCPGAEAGVFRLVAPGAMVPGGGVAGEPEPDDKALVLHTSGSTSRPKRVPQTHRNLCARARNHAAALGLRATDRCLNVMPLFHSHGFTTLLTSLHAGASFVCTPGFDGTQFFHWLRAFRPTWYSAGPTIHQAVLARTPSHPEVLAHTPLRFIRSASFALPPRMMADLEAAFGTPVLQSYGTTEAAPIAVNPPPPCPRRAGSVGLPAGCQVAILNEAGCAVGPGTVGEIVVRGQTVIEGYEDDPAANAQTFRGGWYRTGDQGYLDAAGYLFITGRLNEVINRGGQKIAPREVEDALMVHPAILQAAVFAVPDGRLGQDVAAAVVLRPAASATPAAIREFAAGRVADYKVPRQVLIVPEMPKDATGKVPRRELAQRLGLVPLARGRPAAPPALVSPRTTLERSLASLWAGVLRLGPVGAFDDFFALGGDSLLATRLIARVREALGVDLTVADLFSAPTVATMAATLMTRAARSAPAAEAARMLAELDALSEDETQRLLAEAAKPQREPEGDS